MREAFLQRREVVIKGLNEVPGVKCLKPGGAFYAWPTVTELCQRAGAADSEELRKRILDQAGVALLSDIHFGPRTPGEGEHLRLSFASSIADLEEGVRRLNGFARAVEPHAVGAGAKR
jgi:aspartate/methionine/tyrosine aminotransferase